MKKKVFLSSIIIIITVCALLITAIINEERNRPIVFERMYSIDNLSFIEAGAKTEGSLCLVAPKGEPLIFYRVIFGEYIYSRKVKGKRYMELEGEGSKDYIDKFDEDIFELYNFRTGEVEKTLELVAIAEENTPGKQFNSWDEVFAKAIDGKQYIGWRVYPIEDSYDYRRSEVITYDLDGEKVVDDVNVIPSHEYTEEEVEYFKSFYMIMDSGCNFFENNNLIRESTKVSIEEGGIYIDSTNSWRDGIIAIEMLMTMLPDDNSKLYAEFPELKEYSGKEGDTVKLFFAGYPDAEEIVEMLIEEGTELTYEGCILSRGSTIDGNEHEISCIDDYIKWCDWKKVSRYME